MTAPTASRPAVAGSRPGGDSPDANGDPWSAPPPLRLSLALGGLTLLAVLLLCAVRPLRSSDTWVHLRTGQWLAGNWRWVTADPFSTLARHELVLSGWLGDLTATVAYAALGPAGLVMLRATCVVVMAVLLLRSARLEAELLPAVIAACVGLATTQGVGVDHLAGAMVLAAVCVALWRRTARVGGLPWAVVPVTWLWASVDGTWVLAPVLGVVTVLGLAIGGSRRHALQLLAPVAVSVGAAATTPVGPRLLTGVWSDPSLTGGLLGRSAFVDLTSPTVVLLMASAMLVVACWLRNGAAPTPWEGLHLALAVVFAVSVSSTAPAAACLLTPLVAGALQTFRSRPVPHIARAEVLALVLAVAVALGVSAALSRPAVTLGHGLDPVSRLGPTLQTLPAGTVLLDDVDVSGRLLFSDPGLRLVIDSRAQLYDVSYRRAYLGALTAGPGWRTFVSSTHSGAAILPAQAPLAAALVERLGWRQLAAGQGYVVLQAPSSAP